MIKIVADLSSNYMGDIGLAKQMIQKAATVGVDCIKVQSWQADQLSKNFKGDYKSTYDRHKKTELSDESHYELIDWCKKNDVDFMTTCFDLNRVEFLATLGLKSIKVASPDCASKRLIKKLMDNFETIIISTGMSTENEVKEAIRLLGDHDYVMLHCVSLYPTPLSRCHLKRIDWLKKQGAKRVGFSDHSIGIEASMAAMCMGIEILEKHITMDRTLPGKDQKMSTTPDEFLKICQWRDECIKMLGEFNPPLSEEELHLREIYIGKWGNNK